MSQLIEAKNIYKSYGNKIILEDVSFDVHSGEIIGLLGPNGAGKTTMLKIVSGLIAPDSGRITIEGYHRKNHPYEYRKRIGMMIEQPALYNNMSAYQNMLVQARLYGTPDKQRICELLERFHLNDVGRKKVKIFSLGMKQRLGIAMALYSKPKLLILDEPMNGLDPEGIITMRETLREIANEGVAILISSHILAEIERLCNGILILNNGGLRNVENNKNTVIETSELEQIYMDTLGEESTF